MGKKDQGRLVHEIRDTLIKHDFKPVRITQIETPEGLRGIRTSGFKVEKHHDSKSVRLYYQMALTPPVETMDWPSRQALGAAQMKRLVRYNEILEREGFTCMSINSRDPSAPYSLWRRVHQQVSNA
jgi:hypothetical protein